MKEQILELEKKTIPEKQAATWILQKHESDYVAGTKPSGCLSLQAA